MNAAVTKAHHIYLVCIIVLTLSITAALSYKTYYINFWPTDSYTPYTPTAARIFQQPYLSSMHDIPGRNALNLIMRGKETLILGIAVLQRLLHDTASLFPNILLLIMATGISALTLYEVMRKLLDAHTGFLAFLLYITCVWPYIYALQGAHQPLVLMNFLLASLLLIYARMHRWCYGLSGIFLGLMVFSSPTSPIYGLTYIGLVVYREVMDQKEKINFLSLGANAALTLAGFVAVLFFFTIPDPVRNTHEFIKYLRFSQFGNNFAVYKPFLMKYYPLPTELRGGGWLWIIKYMLFLLPVLFPLYVISLIYLFKLSLRGKRFLPFLLLSLATPIIIETVGVAQFGRNLYSWLIGIIGVICYGFYFFRTRSFPRLGTKTKPIVAGLGVLLLCGHLIFNAALFLGDVLPSRMATTDIYRWLVKNGQSTVHVYHRHPRNINIVTFLNNPKYRQKIQFLRIANIREAKSGYILVPPITGKSIYQECRYPDFTFDPYLTELYHSGKFRNFTAAVFPTLASSRIWVQEEEICTYLDLILGGISAEDRRKGHAFILDADKLQKEWFFKRAESIPIR